jgi:hypothetical protein
MHTYIRLNKNKIHNFIENISHNGNISITDFLVKIYDELYDFNYKFRQHFLDVVYKIYFKTHNKNDYVDIDKMKEILIRFFKV